MSQICVKAIVSGIVQGVGFRYWTSLEANKLGVLGHAVNLPNGDVEVLACGDQGAVEKLLVWLEQGPSSARVETLTCKKVEDLSPNRFTTG